MLEAKIIHALDENILFMVSMLVEQISNHCLDQISYEDDENVKVLISAAHTFLDVSQSSSVC